MIGGIKMYNTINYCLQDDGKLLIFLGTRILAEIENGRADDDFVENVLVGLGYRWNDDGSITKEESQ
jgi:hypothetical protein